MYKFHVVFLSVVITFFFISVGYMFPCISLGAFPYTTQRLGGDGEIGIGGLAGTGGNGGTGGAVCADTPNDATDGERGGGGSLGGSGGSATWTLTAMSPTDVLENNGTIIIGGTTGLSGSTGSLGQYNGGQGGNGGGVIATGQSGDEPYPDPYPSTSQGGSGGSWSLYLLIPGSPGSNGGGGGGGSGGGYAYLDDGGAGGRGGDGKDGNSGAGGTGYDGADEVITTSVSFTNNLTLQIGGNGGKGGNGGQGGSGGGGGGGSGYCFYSGGHVGIGGIGPNERVAMWGSGGARGSGGAAGSGILALQTDGHLVNNAGVMIEVRSNGLLSIEHSTASLINNGVINNLYATLDNYGTYGGSGTINHNFINNFLFRPGNSNSASRHTIGGTYTEKARLLIDIAGTDPTIPQYSSVTVGEQKMVTLDPNSSILQVRFSGGFDESKLNDRDFFDIITFSPSFLDGTFNTIDDSLSPLLLGHWELDYYIESGYVRLIYKRTAPPPLQGIIKNDCNGEKVSSVTVTADNGTIQQTVTTDVNGVYRFFLLPEGIYDISTQRTGYRPQVTEFVSVPAYGSYAILDLSLIPETPLLLGHIMSACPGNQAVSEATITVDSIDLIPSLTRMTLSDSYGFYEFSCLQNGTYQVSVTADDYQSFSTFEMHEERTILDFQLLPFPSGDVNEDCVVDLLDLMQALQILTETTAELYSTTEADINGDNQIGLAEIIYILRKTAGISE